MKNVCPTQTRFTRMMKRVGSMTLSIALFLSTLSGSASAVTVRDEKFVGDYKNIYEVLEAAAAISEETAEEGTVLLKNNGALPLSGGEWVTAFGRWTEHGLQGLENAGFKVYNNSSQSGVDNVVLNAYGDPANFTEAMKSSHKSHSDVALIALVGASGGEGQETGYVTSEEQNYDDGYGNPQLLRDGTEFVHQSSPYQVVGEGEDADVIFYKHGLELNETAKSLIAYATENFDKVVVVIRSSTRNGGYGMLEAGILEMNDGIDAILWTGETGDLHDDSNYSGYNALGKILKGEVNPSGKLNDLWMWDFTASPTWNNGGNSGQSFTTAEAEDAYAYEGVAIANAFRTDADTLYTRRERTGSNLTNIYAVKYEEDIYMGYRYYETVAAEASMNNYTSFTYDNAVVYPFGYGLSYTTFDWEIVGSDTSDWGKQQDAYTRNGQITVKVKVTNTGAYAGKDVVQIYGHAPYFMNGVAKSEVVLVGFEKTKLLKPNESQVLTITVNIQDLASFDWSDANANGVMTYELDMNAGGVDEAGNPVHDTTGKYELRIQTDSHHVKENNGEKLIVALGDLSETIILDQDDYTGNTVETLFAGDNMNNSLGYDPATGMNLVEEGKMTLLSRADFAGTWPQLTTPEDMVRSEEYFAMVSAAQDYNGGSTYDIESYENQEYLTGNRFMDYYQWAYPEGTATNEDDSEFPWAVSEEAFRAMEAESGEWTQGADYGEDNLYFRDMAGVDPDDNVNIYQNTDEKAPYYTTISGLIGKTGSQAWTALMNRMTWDEIRTVVSVSSYSSSAVESIEKRKARYMDGAMQMDCELNEVGFVWGCQPHRATTWNKDLLYRVGVIQGNLSLMSEISGIGHDTWYAPAVNTHREPYGGRNNEYWSEDPYLAGHMAGSLAAGIESKGIITTIKHAALNENETQRQNIHTYLTEQAAREIYFKAFQIVVQEYSNSGMMTSYNAIGDMHSSSNYAFMNALIRQEFGFRGVSVTDAISPSDGFHTLDMLVRGGSSMTISGGATLHVNENQWYMGIFAEYDPDENMVFTGAGKANEIGKTESFTTWYWTRKAAQSLLFAEANSAIQDNGVDMDQVADTLAIQGEFTQGKSLTNASVAVEGIPEASYSIYDGALPLGVELDSTTGELTGRPLEHGSFAFTVEVSSYNHLKTKMVCTMEIAPAMYLDGADVTALKVGDDVNLTIAAYMGMETVSVQKEGGMPWETELIEQEAPVVGIGDATKSNFKFTTMTYMLAPESQLPAGLTLKADGTITGTALVEGDFTTTVVMTGTRTYELGRGNPKVYFDTEVVTMYLDFNFHISK